MVRVVLGADACNLPMCMRCRQYGYCCGVEGESNMVCQKKHWKVGGHRAECAALAAAAADVTAVGEAADMAEGKGDEVDGGPSVGVAGGGDGGGRKKTGGKKGKKGRR